MSRDQTWKQEWGYDVGKGCNSCGLDFTKNNHRECSFPTCLNNARFHFSADHALLCTGYAADKTADSEDWGEMAAI